MASWRERGPAASWREGPVVGQEQIQGGVQAVWTPLPLPFGGNCRWTPPPPPLKFLGLPLGARLEAQLQSSDRENEAGGSSPVNAPQANSWWVAGRHCSIPYRAGQVRLQLHMMQFTQPQDQEYIHAQV